MIASKHQPIVMTMLVKSDETEMEHTRDVEETTLHQLFQEPSDGKGSLYREPTLRGTGHALRR